MGVPVLYAGSKYYPGIPPDKQYPAFSSAEVGNVNASTVAVTFSINISASDYAAGVTIKVNGSAATISSATRQANHAIVYYALSAAVVNGDTVTWEYSGGSIVNEATGAILQTVSAQSVTNNVVPSDPIGDALRADALAYWTLNEASGARADSKGATNLRDVYGAEGVPAKIGNGLLASAAFGAFLAADNSPVVQLVSTHYFALWFKMASDNVIHLFSKIDPDTGFIEYECSYSLGEGLSFFLLQGDVLSSFTFDTNWHLCECYYDADAHEIGMAIDHGTFGTNSTYTLSLQSNEFEIGATGGSTGNADVIIDEFLILPRKPTSDERDYIYNSGAGRALYP